MSDANYPLSVTLKAGQGHDSPWIVVYGHAPDEVQGKLEAIANGGLIEATINAANAFKAANNAAPLAPQGQEAQPQQAVPQQQSPWGQPTQQAAASVAQSHAQRPQPQFGGPQNGTPHPTGQQCPACGNVVQYKAFTSKAGKDFKMWTCPNQRSKGDGHYSEFIK